VSATLTRSPTETDERPPLREQREARVALEAESPLSRLTAEQLEALARELDALHEQVRAELGERDANYIRNVIKLHRCLVIAARVILLGSRRRPLWLAGTAALSLAKILENMEIGHNVLHGQWDWMNDPDINSRAWDWDTASPADAWRHSHNYEHHTFANIRGKDRDLGYEIMRIDPHQKWHPVYLAQPLYNLVLMAFFEWGVAGHDLDFKAIRTGEKSKDKVRRELKGMAGKARDQIVKDYVAFPALSGLLNTGADLALAAAGVERGDGKSRRRRVTEKVRKPSLMRQLIERKSFRQPFKSTLSADFTANVVRNVWAHAIIFCGHFPDQTYTFSQEETDDETRGARYVRQLIGAANIEGGPLFHVISGNLGYQVEHHLFPDMPSTRYGEIAPRVREICERYELPYNSGPFFKQWGMVMRTIARLAFPGGKPRPKPGPYRGEKLKGEGERADRTAGAAASTAPG
jgi:linoleoyl-CoA desaturase